MSSLRYKDDPYVVNMCGAAVTPDVLMTVLLHSALKWRMHAAQLLSLERMSAYMGEHVELVSTTDETKEIMTRNIPHTLCGIPVELHEEFPKNVVQLVQGNKVLGVIELLGVPTVFFEPYNPEEEQRKWQSLLT